MAENSQLESGTADKSGPGEYVHPSAPYPPPGQGGYPPQAAGYPPQQPGYPPAPQGHPGPPPHGPSGHYGPPGTQPSAVVVTQPVVVVTSFTQSPAQTQCPHCGAHIVTATDHEPGTFSWLICILLCVFGCSLGCCLIPFFANDCKDVVHICPNCKKEISRYKRM